MAITITPDQAADKLARRLKSATQDIENGVKAVTESPMKAAAANPDKWVNGVMAARQNGSWQRGLEKVTLEDWKNKMITKGIPRIGSGIDAAMPKLKDFFKQLLPFEANLQTEVDRMPDTTLEDSINRAGAWMRGMAQFQKQ